MTRVKCLQHLEEGLNEHGLQEDALVPWWYWKATLKTCSVHWGDGFIPAISGVRANDLEQLMREKFRVKVCERVWLMSLASLARNNSSKRRASFEALGSQTMNKGLHYGADVLDQRETQQCRPWIDTALNVGQNRSETQYTTGESARFMSDPTRAVKCMLKRLRKYHSEASVHSWSFPYQEMQCEVRVVEGAYWEGELEGLSTTGAWIYFGGYLMETYSLTLQIVALSTTESEYISTKDVANALEIRSDLAECDMTLNMKGKTDVTAGRATAARRGVRRVRHLDARFSWLQHFVSRRRGSLVSAFQPAWRTQRGRPVDEEDRFDITFERNTLWATNEFIELELTAGGRKFHRD